jgi:hypothetical protein
MTKKNAVRAVLFTMYTLLTLVTDSKSTQHTNLQKNEEYVCVRWTGSADWSQNRPSVCLLWEKRPVPWYRRK